MVLHGDSLIADWFENMVHRKIKETVRGRSKRNEESPEEMKVILGFIA